jgi:chromosome segregation ATPase
MPTTDELAGRIEELEAKLESLQKEVMADKVDSLKARLEELEVQLNLGGKDARDEMAPLLEQLRNRWLDLRGLLDHATSSAGDALSGASDNVRSSASDLRSRLEDATARLRRSGDGG